MLSKKNPQKNQSLLQCVLQQYSQTGLKRDQRELASYCSSGRFWSQKYLTELAFYQFEEPKTSVWPRRHCAWWTVDTPAVHNQNCSLCEPKSLNKQTNPQTSAALLSLSVRNLWNRLRPVVFWLAAGSTRWHKCVCDLMLSAELRVWSWQWWTVSKERNDPECRNFFFKTLADLQHLHCSNSIWRWKRQQCVK